MKWGSRRGLKRYRCEAGHNFSIDYRPKSKLLDSYLAGPSIRNLAAEHGSRRSTIADRLRRELSSLPKNEIITQAYCTRFGGVLCLDGVYLSVKGFSKKIPFIYGIDFITHDIPAGILALAENEMAFGRLFSILEAVGYPLRFAVSDESPAILPALYKVFPGAGLQLCHVHILRNIRNELHLSSYDKRHLSFFLEIKNLLNTYLEENRRNIFQDMAARFGAHAIYADILKSLYSRSENLFRYESIRRLGLSCPKTNNLIEAFNGHLKSRVNSIKGFESLSSAERFMNAWMIRRRFTPFRDCGKHFKHLNGHTSFSKSRNLDLPYPDILL